MFNKLKLFISFTLLGISLLPVRVLYAGQEHQINIRLTAITPPCKINNGQDIIVNFGDSVVTTQIDGRYKRVPIEYTIDCKSAVLPDLKMTISGTGAEFDKNFLTTDNSDLGVAIYHDSEPFMLNSSVNFNITNVVKRKESVLPGGKFTASATISIDYQ